MRTTTRVALVLVALFVASTAAGAIFFDGLPVLQRVPRTAADSIAVGRYPETPTFARWDSVLANTLLDMYYLEHKTEWGGCVLGRVSGDTLYFTDFHQPTVYVETDSSLIMGQCPQGTAPLSAS